MAEGAPGIYFEIDAGSSTAGEFPSALGPFNVGPATGISPSALKIEWGPVSTWATTERKATLPKSALTGSGTTDLAKALPDTITITLSPLYPVNLSAEQAKNAGIPSGSQHFVWAYPIDLCGVPSSAVNFADADTAFLSAGAFIYFDTGLQPIQINALVPSGSGGLKFGPPKEWQPGWTGPWESQGRKFHPITLLNLLEKGFTHFAWISPNTNLGGRASCPHGGFAYLKRGGESESKGIQPLPARTYAATQNPKNNIILTTDGYKFSHHKQFPVSWLPSHARPSGSEHPPILFPPQGNAQGAKILRLRHVPRLPGDEKNPYKLTVVTNVSTAVATIEPTNESPDITYNGTPVVYTGTKKTTIVLALGPGQCKGLKLPENFTVVKFQNIDESKLKRGSDLNGNFEGGYNVSYFTPRAYSHVFSHLTGDNVVFFGLQYFIREYLAGEVVTPEIIDEADAYIARYMADVRVAGPGVDHEGGYDYTMFPRGDWDCMVSGDYDATGATQPGLRGKLPIKIEALAEGTLLTPGTCCFKITNTHPRFYWLPNFLETLLVQVWYPTSVATQAREFKKTIQAYSILSQRVSQMAPVFNLPGEFTLDGVIKDNLAIHVAQVFDLLDFGYRGVSSHETASLGAASYYTAGLEGSDTVAGSRMLLQCYNGGENFTQVFEAAHGATSVPAAEHSTITSWADVSEDADPVRYEAAEYNAFRNMMKQYAPSFAVSLVSDGFNIWNAVTRLWPSKVVPADGGDSMHTLINERLQNFKLTLIRPDSGEGVETLPQLLTILHAVLNEHWQAELPPMGTVFPAGEEEYERKYNAVVDKIKAKVGTESNPFRRFTGQQMRVLQGDGVALDTVGDMLASLLANGFCANCVHFGSGGGLLQKLNRDSLAVAFKCCAMYVGGKCYPVGKDPIAGGKKSYGGNPPVIRGTDGVLRNRGQYDEKGNMVKAEPMTYAEFMEGVPGDELVKVYESGALLVEQTFTDIQKRARITEKALLPAMKQAVDNLTLKLEFLQMMSSDKAIACRLAEAACGSKWKHAHETSLASIKQTIPKYVDTFEKIGITDNMNSVEVMEHIRTNLVCDKKQAKKVFRSLEDDEPEKAIDAMGGKIVLTL